MNDLWVVWEVKALAGIREELICGSWMDHQNKGQQMNDVCESISEYREQRDMHDLG